jgi:hypothetical protein
LRVVRAVRLPVPPAAGVALTPAFDMYAGSVGFDAFAPANDNASAEDAQRAADIEAAWESGDLYWKLDPHQYDVYEQFTAWNARRLTDEYLAQVEATEAEFDDVFVHEAGRRVGKTHEWLLVAMECALKRPGAVLTYATAYQKDIADIIVKLADLIAIDAPDDIKPRYRGSQGENHEGLFFPNGSVVKLVGVDKHPDALRGRFSDGMFFSEAGFIKGLDYLLRSVVLPQFQRRPWAFCVLESSTPVQPDHDFKSLFVPDAQKRDAYRMQTIDDNKAISEREKAKALRQAGGRGHPVCEREYYCAETRDPEVMVIPEFDPAKHVREVERPTYVHCYGAADPGSRDLFGLVFGYWDFLGAYGVIEASWARRNASTRLMACIVALYEWRLWGRWPSKRYADIPLRSDTRTGKDGWLKLLEGEASEEECVRLFEMATASPEKRPEESWREPPPAEHCAYWDGRKFVQNPYLRVTDIAIQFVQDMSVEYGITFGATAKDDAEAQRNNLRDAFGSGKIIMLPTAGPVIAHVKNAKWNENRTDYERSKVFGHFDCMAALIYWWRNVQRNLACSPPQHVGKDPGAHHISGWAKQKPQSNAAKALERAFTGGNRFKPQRRAGGMR